MPQYIGYSSINANKPRSTQLTFGTGMGTGSVTNPVIPGKKYKLVDEQLVIQDFVNAFNIRQGEKVGQPEYGTTIWGFLFEPNNLDTQQNIEAEVRRVAGLDPRMTVNSVTSFTQDHGILVECEVAVVPFNNATTINLFFDNLTDRASLQSS